MLGSKDVDVGIVVDLSAENIPFLLTIVDSLEVDPRENHIGVIVSQGAKKIHVKLSDPAGSKDETTLLRYIQDAARKVTLQVLLTITKSPLVWRKSCSELKMGEGRVLNTFFWLRPMQQMNSLVQQVLLTRSMN